jgi:hypothetical protein
MSANLIIFGTFRKARGTTKANNVIILLFVSYEVNEITNRFEHSWMNAVLPDDKNGHSTTRRHVRTVGLPGSKSGLESNVWRLFGGNGRRGGVGG